MMTAISGLKASSIVQYMPRRPALLISLSGKSNASQSRPLQIATLCKVPHLSTRRLTGKGGGHLNSLHTSQRKRIGNDLTYGRPLTTARV